MIKPFAELGEFLSQYLLGQPNGFPESWKIRLDEACELAARQNPWFTPQHIKLALNGISIMLNEENLVKWLTPYGIPGKTTVHRRNIGVIMAGNIPLVGFHDFLCVLVSGHRFTGKLSSDDKAMLPVLAAILCELEPGFAPSIQFTEGRLPEVDAIIATGSDNTFRYFEYYFSNKPHILRKNRNAVAVLTGRESLEELSRLGEDIFQYFGLGCRNVSKLFVPLGYDFSHFFKAIESFQPISLHHKYINNYDYYKSIYLVNGDSHFDNGFLLVKPDENRIAAPVSVVFYEEYNEIETVKQRLKALEDKIQCVVSEEMKVEKAVRFGQAQLPFPWDYADGVDTVDFLISLK